MIVVDYSKGDRALDTALKKFKKMYQDKLRAYMDHTEFRPKRERRDIKAARAARKRRIA